MKQNSSCILRFYKKLTPSISLSVLLAAAPLQAHAETDLTSLSMEDLMNIQVTSASRKQQTLANVASAAFVISQEDISRSGATTIPDLLRMVPGVQVAKIDANKWAVSIRGFNGRFATKLLVLKDGRSVYTPLFSGVYWDSLDTPLEDIERIEVIRGPGAAMWGANAVNGVINIITKSAADTKGGLISAGGGTVQHGFGSARYGTSVGKDSDLRLYAKYTNRAPDKQSNGDDANDAWQRGTAGFRLDSRISSRDSFTLQSDHTKGSFDETYTLYRLPTVSDPSYSWIQQSSTPIYSGNILGRWQRTISDTDSLSLQFYYDRYERDMYILKEERDTFDLDFQHRFALGERQDVIWGLGYRFSHDKLGATAISGLADPEEGLNLFSAFVQNEIKLIPEKLVFTIGSRFEHNDYTGFEFQPNAKLIWTPNPKHTVWASVSRAIKTPSRGERGFQYRFFTMPPTPGITPIPLRLEIVGTEGFKSETVLAYELGYRTEPMQNMTFDLALFYNQYDNLRVRQNGIQSLEATNAVLTYPLTNDMHGHTYGAEISASWRIYDWWRMQAAYSYLGSIMHLDNGSTDEINRSNAAGGSPRNQGSLRSAFNLNHNIELDLWLRAVDRVKSIDIHSIPGYVTGDARIAWHLSKAMEISLVGRNLFQSRHPEYRPEYINTFPSEVPRSVYGKLTWKF
jgi:iron complex outermembrane recepter protein